MKSLFLALLLAGAVVFPSDAAEEELISRLRRVAADEGILKELAASESWQVRYCAATDFNRPTAAARACLERLCADSDPRVASHAFSAYTRLFVRVDRELLRRRIELLHPFYGQQRKPTLNGALSELQWRITHDAFDINDPETAGRIVPVTGILGEAAEARHLKRFQSSGNPYILLITAQALHRLGDTGGYHTCLRRILRLEGTGRSHYRGQALDALRQTDPAAFKAASERVEAETGGHPQIHADSIFHNPEFHWPTAAARVDLERLCAEGNPPVASEAFAVYTSLFVRVDRELLRRRIELLHPVHGQQGKPTRSGALAGLGRAHSNITEEIELVGILGKAEDAGELKRFQSSDNPHVLFITAQALYRLGDAAGYRACLESILGLDFGEHFGYHIHALNALWQTDRADFKAAHERVGAEIGKHPQIPPGAVYTHALQGKMLPPE